VPIELPQGPCIFCERIAGDRADWAVIEEDDATVSLINPRQFEEGQALVIPKRHAPTLLDLSGDEAAALMLVVLRVARAMVAAFDPDGLTLFQNNGVASHQQVPHVHMHVVPRRYGGGWGEGPPHLAALTHAEIEERFQADAAPIEQQTALAQRLQRHLEAR
jgi:histidine triad (HIT) family protein